jgi:hypothetical protein
VRPRLRGSLFVAAALASLLPATVSAADSPSKVLASIVAAAHAKRSVHYTSVGNYAAAAVSFVADAGVDRGIQHITYRNSGRTGHVTVIVTANTAYIRGDAFTLANYLGFKSTPAVSYAGRWVRFPHTDRSYAVIAAGVTLSSLVDEIALGGQLSRAPVTNIGGQRVLAVRGTASSSKGTIVSTVYAAAAGPPLPVKQITTRGTLSLSMSFSLWNERIDLAAPRASVAISVVRQAPPGPIA